jgi:hypothetical protein
MLATAILRFGVGQLAVESRVVILGAPADIKLIRFCGKKIQHFLAGNKVGEDSQRHRLLIHLAIVSACSVRAPGVVK